MVFITRRDLRKKGWSKDEIKSLKILREKCRQDKINEELPINEIFSPKGQSRLDFLKWLSEKGKLNKDFISSGQTISQLEPDLNLRNRLIPA